jgi:hypothetical protein
MRSYTKIDDRTLGLNVKKNGKPTISARIVVSARRQKPHGHHEQNRCDGQKDQQHRGVRQALRGCPALNGVHICLAA